MARKKKEKKIIEKSIEEELVIKEPIVEEKIVKKPIIEEIIIKNPCPKCGTEMVQHGGGPGGYKDYKCPACGAGLSKR